MPRTYTKKEVEEILRRAARSTAQTHDESSRDSGLSLDDLIHIGSETGLNPDEVVRAAQALDRVAPELFERRLLGFDISASHSVRLPGRISDEEWGSLVSDCRRTFFAKGTVVDSGPLREWSNGNLHVTTEPEGSDTLLTFRTHRGMASSLLTAAAATFFVTMLMSTRMWSGDFLEFAYYIALSLMGTASIVFAAMGTVGTKRWAKTRKSQMETLAARAGARRTQREPAPTTEPSTAATADRSLVQESSEPRIHLNDELESPGEEMADLRSKARD